jgi:hypothetical protein
MSRCGLGIYIRKYLKAKEELWKLKYFTIQKYNLQNNPHVMLWRWHWHLHYKYLKAKEKLWKLKYFTIQKYNLHKNPLKRNQNPSRYQNSITNLKFQHMPKHHLSKTLV